MKILQVIPVFNRSELFGGSQQVVFQISKELVRKGHEVVIYTSDAKRSNLSERTEILKEEIEGISILRFKNLSPFLSNKLRMIFTPTMKKTIEVNINYFDVIHLHEARSYQHICVYQIAKKHNISYIVQTHGCLRERSGLARTIYDLLFIKKIFNNSKKLIAISQPEAEHYKSFSIPGDKIKILSNGLTLADYEKLPKGGLFRKNHNIGNKKKIILYLGRIHKNKGLVFLLNSFSCFIKESRSNNVLLVLAGIDDGFLNEVKLLINNLNLNSHVLYVGSLEEHEKLSAFMDSSIIISPEKSNVYLLVPLEAAACGKPVIVTHTNYISKLVKEGGFGLSVEYGNTSELSETIKMMINDEDLLKKMGKNGRDYVHNNLGWNNIIDKLLHLYKKIVYN